MARPRKPHYAATFKVLHYLKNEPGRGVFFAASSELHVKGFSTWSYLIVVLCTWSYMYQCQFSPTVNDNCNISIKFSN